MTDSDASEQTDLELITLSRDEPETSENRNTIVQEKYIAQLLQQMAVMQTEIERLQNLTNLSISANTPLPEQGTDATAPQIFSSPEPPFPQNLPDDSPLCKTNPQHTNPQASPQQSPLQNDPASFTTPHTQITTLIQNTPSAQTHPADQHILMAHTADHSKQYVPPIYVTEAQPSTTATPNMTLQKIGQCEEMDRRVRIKTDESVAREIYSLKEAFKNIQTSKGHEGLEYEDLCMHPDIELPVGYKVPKFGLFDGKGNPHTHLKSYCDKLIGVGKDQAIIMKLFVRSLTREALDWYTSQNPQKWRNWGTMAQDFVDRFKFNTDTVLDRFYLMKLEKKSTETFREYAMKWRAEAAKVQPPIEESEMTTLFVQSLKDATYYERMISVVGRSFSEVIRMRDFIEEGIRTGRITNFVALQATSETIQLDSFEGAVKRKRDGVSSVVTPIPGNVPNPVPKWHDETKHCAYHSGIPGHDTENCYALRDKIEALIKEGVIQLKGPSSNVNDNSLPDHDDANVNIITVDEEHNLEGTIVPVQREEKVESSAFITPMITVQVRAPFGVEVFPPKSRVMASSFLGKVLSTNLRRKGDASLPKSVPLLGQSFVKTCATQESKEDNAANLVKGFKRFFMNEEEAKCSVILDDHAKGSTI
ncbi:hypothetical protein K7X08_015157 [Anisodus acutangulus]|uniref:Retrotransposon gag domain-containing protein n=1 Tax=Anisodus acutangulus TaxID=402998 RepID=A0A9Q1L2X4_9SOLA|nr:hypothetical protein K7X08_015157 [Anisodus acutangulus]